MKTKPDLSFWKLWDLSFGFFGVQIAYALQSANVSRIFTTIGADPHALSYFWVLPPLMGMLVQPIVGMMSDRTWTSVGRRLPYLIVGALVAVVVMCLLPNSGSFNFSIPQAILFGVIALMLLDTSINMAMQPFKMLVGDMVNEKQKGLAYSIQSFLCNAGSVVGYIFPICLAWIGIRNEAAAGVVPDTVIWSFYIGAAILLMCVIYSLVKIKEWPPHVYNEYNGGGESEKKGGNGPIALLRKAPSTFWTVGLVQFFCWFAFLFLWTYATNTVAYNAFHTPTTESVSGLVNETTGKTLKAPYVVLNESEILLDHGTLKCAPEALTMSSDAVITTADIVVEKDGKLEMEGGKNYDVAAGTVLTPQHVTVLNAASPEYNAAGNWVGLLYAVQALGSVAWALMLPRFRSRKLSYILSLVLGGVGFIMMSVVTNQYLLFVAFILIGCAWAAMLAWPFTILTNSLKGGNIGGYLGLFNCTICLPQIIAALAGGWILSLMSTPGQLAPEYNMMLVAGVMIMIGAVCVLFIKEGGKETPAETPAESDNI